MVGYAPKFYEIAKKIVEITDNKIFVAHNSSFDYNIVKAEFKRLGYEYRRKTLCTVKLSRKIMPGLPSYSLGNLCQFLNIKIENRHRAGGDALATVKLFELLLKRNSETGLFTPADKQALRNLHPLLHKEKIETLPEKTGVYYFFNEYNELIYIGKSKNIYERIISHLNNQSKKNAILLRDSIADIDYELTGSELIALLKESAEIKQSKPIFNRAQKKVLNTWGIFEEYSQQLYLQLIIKQNSNIDSPISTFETKDKAKEYLYKIVKKFKLCQKYCGLFDSKGACFQYTLHECNGACIGAEDPEQYNIRVQDAIISMGLGPESKFIIDTGRHENERAVVKIYKGKYIGYGFLDISEGINNIEYLHECIQIQQDNRDVQKILKNFLKNNKVERIIRF